MKRTILTMVLALVLSSGVLATAQRSGAERGNKARDPVCNIMVSRNPELSVRHGNTTYYFCMKKDMVAFQKDPDKYLTDSSHNHPDPNS